MKCFKCYIDNLPDDEQEVELYKYFMVGLDIPYVNLFFHKKCYAEINDINEFLHQNTNLVYNYIRDTVNIKPRRRRNGRKTKTT